MAAKKINPPSCPRNPSDLLPSLFLLVFLPDPTIYQGPSFPSLSALTLSYSRPSSSVIWMPALTS